MAVDRQTSSDIVREIVAAHQENAWAYDRIAEYFQADNLEELCRELWNFCKGSMVYYPEDGETQNVSSPWTILTRKKNDCKNYASFIGGVLDSLKRRGCKLTWVYRFVSYDPIRPAPYHVFVVVNPNTDNIFIDPVMDEFNERLWYWWKSDKRPRVEAGAAMGFIGCCMGTTAQENQLLQDVKNYADGLSDNIGQSYRAGAFNTVSSLVLQGVAIAAIPGAAEALALLKGGALLLDNAFGAGSAAARLVTDISNLDIVGLFKDLQGRTYNTDQYWAAVYYQFYVLGKNVTDINRVLDSDVLPALKWFIDRSNVFISGREHIIALGKSANAYTNYYGVNHDTTTDPVRTAAASVVAQLYWHNPGNFDPALLGSWKNTIGVFDNGLVQLALQIGTSPEKLARDQGLTDTESAQYLQAAAPALASQSDGNLITGVPDLLLFGVAAGAVFLLTNPKF
jgi:hypothetical protein